MYFEELQPWALIPRKFSPDLKAARAKRDLLRDNFAHYRAERLPEFCPPWVQGQTIGWRVASPVDVRLTPLEQFEIPAAADRAASARAMGGQSHVWHRDKAALATMSPAWLSGYEFLDKGERHSMFLPNGLDTVEWRLGWSVAEPNEFGLLIIPSAETPDLGTQVGFLSAKTLERIAGKGTSIAVAPRQTVSIARGQEIARIIPISAEALAL
ncbi:hypothetical protein [Leifsonia sp. 2MCAF36]|uniref:hypothetical protein n=1 Tax=Leifsonia sp. 2MCAF36 TaxID=3232988 RepID=UPI003F98A969